MISGVGEEPARRRSSWLPWVVWGVAIALGLYSLESDDDDDDDDRPNPRAARDAQLEHARRAWSEFHWGRQARKVSKRRASPTPRTLVELGTLEEVTYRTKKGKDRTASWVHAFGEDGGRKPTLAMDPRNRRLHVVGGDYTVTERGIED